MPGPTARWTPRRKPLPLWPILERVAAGAGHSAAAASGRTTRQSQPPDRSCHSPDWTSGSVDLISIYLSCTRGGLVPPSCGGRSLLVCRLSGSSRLCPIVSGSRAESVLIPPGLWSTPQGREPGPRPAGRCRGGLPGGGAQGRDEVGQLRAFPVVRERLPGVGVVGGGHAGLVFPVRAYTTSHPGTCGYTAMMVTAASSPRKSSGLRVNKGSPCAAAVAAIMRSMRRGRGSRLAAMVSATRVP